MVFRDENDVLIIQAFGRSDVKGFGLRLQVAGGGLRWRRPHSPAYLTIE
jgi:hypothetical protein